MFDGVIAIVREMDGSKRKRLERAGSPHALGSIAVQRGNIVASRPLCPVTGPGECFHEVGIVFSSNIGPKCCHVAEVANESFARFIDRHTRRLQPFADAVTRHRLQGLANVATIRR